MLAGDLRKLGEAPANHGKARAREGERPRHPTSEYLRITLSLQKKSALIADTLWSCPIGAQIGALRRFAPVQGTADRSPARESLTFASDARGEPPNTADQAELRLIQAWPQPTAGKAIRDPPRGCPALSHPATRSAPAAVFHPNASQVDNGFHLFGVEGPHRTGSDVTG